MHKKAHEHIWLPFLQFLTDFNETLSKCWIQDFLKPHKLSAFLDNFFFHSFQGGTKGKKLKNQKKQKKCSQMCSSAFLCISPFKIQKSTILSKLYLIKSLATPFFLCSVSSQLKKLILKFSKNLKFSKILESRNRLF